MSAFPRSFRTHEPNEYSDRNLPIPTRDENRTLALRAQSGDQAALQELWERNIPLAKSAALRYRWTGQPLDDLIQEALLGIARAVETYDPRWAFSTYASWWMRAYLTHFTKRESGARCLMLEDEQHAETVPSVAERWDSDVPDEAERVSLQAALDTMDARLAHVIVSRACGETMEDVGVCWGVSKARIGQLEQSAIVLLREHFGLDGNPSTAHLCGRQRPRKRQPLASESASAP